MNDSVKTSGRTGALLWTVLAISAALNAALSTVNIVLAATFGVVVLACAAGLITRHYRGRR